MHKYKKREILALVHKHHAMKAHERYGDEPLCFGARWKQKISSICTKLSLALIGYSAG
jgi:hypothetical protein